LKVLLSAYACEPGKGSEPGVGWHWAREIAALGNETWVLTRANNQASIEEELASMQSISNLHFLYYDLPPWMQRWKKLPGGVYLYYLLWQWGAFRFVKAIHRQQKFDWVHHITFVSIHMPGFMGDLGIPFILGPVAGGERAPWRLRVGYSWSGWVKDGIRDLANWFVRINPIARRAMSKAQHIYVTSEQTLALVPRAHRAKASILLAIGAESYGDSPTAQPARQADKNRVGFEVLFVGHFLYLKGMHLGLTGFANLLSVLPEAHLTMVGSGPDEIRWRNLAAKLNISDSIEWIPWLPQSELAEIYSKQDAFLFPSLHDSGGLVVLEALAHGLPVICLALGGPGVVVNKFCGRVVPVAGVSTATVAKRLASAIEDIGSNAALYEELSHGARLRASEYEWRNVVAAVYGKKSAHDFSLEGS
jgi:glycosyltransferase involved in cell wall biosynthesis